jgi:23S rRNA (uracil1939-C5)-methyltransferase
MSRRKPIPTEPLDLEILRLSPEGRGVARTEEGKAIFVSGALPGERVRARIVKRHRRHDEASVLEVLQASPDRVEPACAAFSVCGGCSLQHLDHAQQIASKQAALLEQLERIGGVKPKQVLAPIMGPQLGYRRTARIGVKHVDKRGEVLVGFREKHSSYIVDMQACPVLVPQVGEQIAALRSLIAGLEAKSRIAQIQVASGDNATVLVLRNLDPLSDSDRRVLAEFAQAQGLKLWLQPGNETTIAPLTEHDRVELSYALPAYDLKLTFLPTDFVQVNAAVNQQMIQQALDLLAPQSGERVLDLFCGLGNFTLPLARSGARVTGVEGDAGLVERARLNASQNGLDADFYVANLFEEDLEAPWLRDHWDALLLDPPRSGAEQIVRQIRRLNPQRIVYVSCDPSTLARDAGILKEQGYRLEQAGILDMFPHTTHVESMARFVRIR